MAAGAAVRKITRKSVLLGGAALAFCAGQAWAQTPAGDGGGDQLEEVVVTATRQSENINRVPLSITAETQRALDQKSIRNLADLQGNVPALQITGPGGTGVAYPTIRGVQGSGVGVAATTGFYLDDTPLQKRNPGGGSSAGYSAGTPIPPLFDLDRVEVLRGPQGTLFGGGSEGGTVRFITPTPSLTTYSTYVRGEVSSTQYGDPSWEVGVAGGGPIVKDKLAFRASVWKRDTGGWIDTLDRYTGAVRYKNGNDAQARLARVSMLWAPTDRARVLVSYFGSRDHSNNVAANTTLSTTMPVVEPTMCYNNAALTPQRPVAYPSPIGFGDATCAQLTAQGVATFTRPGATYGPFNLGKDDQIGLADFRWPATTNVQVGSVTVDYDFGGMTLKSITSYIHDNTNQRGGSGIYITTNRNANATYGNVLINRGLDFSAACRTACAAGAHIDTFNRRYGLTQELRLASAGDARPLSWVAGVFYSNQRIHNQQYATITEEESLSVFGVTVAQRFGVSPFRTPWGAPDGYTFLDNTFKDVEVAGFGEANYWVTDRLRVTAGIRISHVDSSFDQVTFGPVAGYAVPTTDNGGITGGRAVESPVTPRATIQYQLSERDMVYVTASKGFRAGGGNAPLPLAFCGPSLALYGLTPDAVPRSYKSDSVWNYEAGGKFRLFDNRLQLNSSVYRIDWTNAQLSASFAGTCGISFLMNSGSARVEGFEVEGQARLFRGLTADFALGYMNGRYLEDAVAIPANPANPTSQPLVSALAGQKFAGSPLTIQLGARYDVELGAARAYVRGDWSYAKRATRTATDIFGPSTYAPDRVAESTNRTNVRVGVEYSGFDINVFVNNLFNSRKGVTTGGRASCAGPTVGGTAACTSFVSYNPLYALTSAYWPRQIGLQVAYRH